MRNEAGRRMLGVVLVLAVVGLASCEDLPSGPTTPRSRRSYEYGSPSDSNPQACMEWDCRSLTDAEWETMFGASTRCQENALANYDTDCWMLCGRASQNLYYEKVYYANQTPWYAPPVTGGFNHGYPNETYIRWDRFASISDALQTLLHETGHDVDREKPSHMDQDTWESQLNYRADRCIHYTWY